MMLQPSVNWDLLIVIIAGCSFLSGLLLDKEVKALMLGLTAACGLVTFSVTFASLWAVRGWLAVNEYFSGPDAQIVLTVRCAATGFVFGFVAAHASWSGFGRFIASCSITASLLGTAWGTVQFWIEDVIYRLPFSTTSINGVLYAQLRMHENVVRTSMLAVLAGVGCLATMAGFHMRERVASTEGREAGP